MTNKEKIENANKFADQVINLANTMKVTNLRFANEIANYANLFIDAAHKFKSEN